MSGICGFSFAEPGARAVSEDLAAMARPLATFGAALAGSFVEGSAAAGSATATGQTSGSARITTPKGALAVAFFGTLQPDAESPQPERGASALCARILDLYLEDGPSFPQRLRGEFAIALWDGRDRAFHLVTDRFRIHPLFYHADDSRFIFASRTASLLAHPAMPVPSVLPEAVVDLVFSSAIPTPKTIYREIQKLPPAHRLRYRDGEISVEPYWDLVFEPDHRTPERTLAARLRELLDDAVSAQLEREDDPDRIGTYLSGGVDSSTVTGILTRRAGQSIKSFSIGFAEQQFNEIRYARIAAGAFGVEHHEHFVTPAEVLEAVPVLLTAFDEPFANASAVPAYFCAKLARDHGVERLYAGDGGDELFAGNERYAVQRLFDDYFRIPAPLRRTVLEPFVAAMAQGTHMGVFQRARKYIERAKTPYPQRLDMYGYHEAIPMDTLFEDDFLRKLGSAYDPGSAGHAHYHRARARTELDRQLYVDLKITISDNDLIKVTRTAQAAGIAARFPFLDHRLAEFAATVPAELKMRGPELRSFFKRAYKDFLPRETRTKKKHGFGLPIPTWLRTDTKLNGAMRDLVLSPRSVTRGYFRPAALEDIVRRHAADRTSFYGTLLWNLMVLELWHRRRDGGRR